MAYPKGVRPRPGGHVQIYVQHRGRTHYRTLRIAPTEAGLAQAAKVREEWAARIRYGLEETEAAQTDPGLRFDEVAQEYLDGADLKLSSRNTYRDLLNAYWIPVLGTRRIGSIRYRDLRRVDRETDWPGPLLRKNAVTALRRVFDFAVAEDYLSTNPAAQLRVRRVQRRAGPDPYTAAERAKILAWVDAQASPGQAMTTHLAFGTGMRTGELLALRWEDWDGEALTVQRSRVRGEISTVKTDRARRVLVDPGLRKRLLEHRMRTRGPWVLTTSTGEPYRYPGKAFRQYRLGLEKLKIRQRVGPYPWRHTYASLGLMAGVEPAFLARQLGHSLEVFYRTYATWIRGDQDREQMARLAEAWQSAESGDQKQKAPDESGA